MKIELANNGLKGVTGVAANVLDCDIRVNEFKLHLHYYVHFWEKYDPSYSLGYLLDCTTTGFFTRLGLVLNNPQRLICH